MKFLSRLLGLSLPSLLAMGLCLAARQQQEGATNKAGEALYKQRCAACHEGAVSRAPSPSGVEADVSGKRSICFTEREYGGPGARVDFRADRRPC